MGKALHKVRQYQQNALAPQLLRILFTAEPHLVDKILRADSTEVIAFAIKREARQARLSPQENSRPAAGEEEKKRPATEARTHSGRGVSAPAAVRGRGQLAKASEEQSKEVR